LGVEHPPEGVRELALQACASGREKVRVKHILAAKGSRRLVMVTAYDYPSAIAVDRAGVDMILVGDSLGMVVLGYDSTLPVTLDDMVRHTAAVARARPCAFLVADMPFMSYEPSVSRAVESAGALVRAGAEAVKLEGGSEYADRVAAISRAGIPVVGHIGLTPQRMHMLSGYRRRGKTESEVQALVEDARALEEAGAIAIVVEYTKADAAKAITDAVSVPTICIGSGPHCDGQVLVLHDIVGYTLHSPPFAKRYANLLDEVTAAVAAFAREVREGAFPGPEHYK
jgi:3-methyl-2-oxobutanoate hydroxymethyltransferase